MSWIKADESQIVTQEGKTMSQRFQALANKILTWNYAAGSEPPFHPIALAAVDHMVA